MDGLSKPKMPFTFRFRRASGGSFRDKIKIVRVFLYIFLAMCAFSSISCMLFFPITQEIYCNYKGNSYNCSLYSKTILRKADTVYYNNLTRAVIASKLSTSNGERVTLFGMQFEDTEGKQLPLNGTTWTSDESSVNKNISNFNRLIDAKKDFYYKLPFDGMFVIGILMFLGVSLLFIMIIDYFSDNYIYEETSPGVYSAVLKGKGIGKLREEEKAALLQQVLEVKQQQNQVPDTSWNKNDQAFIDRDIEDITKQFYDDGK